MNRIKKDKMIWYKMTLSVLINASKSSRYSVWRVSECIDPDSAIMTSNWFVSSMVFRALLPLWLHILGWFRSCSKAKLWCNVQRKAVTAAAQSFAKLSIAKEVYPRVDRWWCQAYCLKPGPHNVDQFVRKAIVTCCNIMRNRKHWKRHPWNNINTQHKPNGFDGLVILYSTNRRVHFIEILKIFPFYSASLFFGDYENPKTAGSDNS